MRLFNVSLLSCHAKISIYPLVSSVWLHGRDFNSGGHNRLQPLTRGLGQDELYTAVHFIEAGSIRNAIFSNAAFNNHIGYSVMAQVSENLFGHSEWSLRLPALVLGLGSLYLFWIFSEPMLAFYGAMIGTIMLALSPPHVVWSVEARGYSAMVFFAILSSYFYLRLLRRPTWLVALCYIVASLGGIYVHLVFGFCHSNTVPGFGQTSYLGETAGQAGMDITPALRRLVFYSFVAIAILSLVAYAPVARTMVNDLISRGHGRFDPTFPWAIIRRLSGSEQFLITGLMLLYCTMWRILTVEVVSAQRNTLWDSWFCLFWSPGWRDRSIYILGSSHIGCRFTLSFSLPDSRRCGI